MKRLIWLAFCAAYAANIHAQLQKPIVLETNNAALVFTVAKNKHILQSYLGKKLPAAEYDLMTGGREPYLTAGMENQFEPAIRVVHADGNPSLDLEFQKSERSADELSIYLKDPVYQTEVKLVYKIDASSDIISAHSEITNHEKKPVMMTEYASSQLHLNADSYWLTQFHGDWAREVEMVEEKLTHGVKNLETKLGTRANFYQTQMFMVSLNGPSTETEGEVLGGTLAWTGNYQYSFEIDQKNSLRVRSGINAYASEYYLQPEEKFITPDFIFTYTNKGKGQMSRNFHRWARTKGLRDGMGDRMVLLNNWEATHMSFTDQKLVELFDEGKKIGADLFLLDDGWFGNKYPRDDDKAGLGDWQEDKKKLPGGIGYLVKEAEAKGIKFGIWLEPEMVNPKSELYEQHPDWILKLPNRAESYGRNQLVLDLINPKVQDFVYGIIDGMMQKNPGIAFIKWDCNRSMTNAYSPYLKQDQWKMYIEYTRSFYKLMERIRAKYPKLPIMLCSGGGGRTDYGALKYFTEFWPSDNTDGLERIFIQWGYSYFFPSIAISSHVTSMGKGQSLKFRMDVAMMDKLGFDIRVNSFTPQELNFAREAVKTYKALSPVIWQGELYRLISPYDEERAVVMYVDQQKQKAVLFNYITSARRKDLFTKVKLQGLDPAKNYRIREVNLFPDTKSTMPDNGKLLSGDYLMNVGLNTTPGRGVALTSNIFEIVAE